MVDEVDISNGNKLFWGGLTGCPLGGRPGGFGTLYFSGDYRNMGITEIWGLQKYGVYRNMGFTEIWGASKQR